MRTFHFGKGVEGDAAIRALILAVLLRDIAGYDENPFIRANCFLAETGKPTVMLNKRYGEKEELEPLTAGMAEKLFTRALAIFMYLVKSAFCDWLRNATCLNIGRGSRAPRSSVFCQIEAVQQTAQPPSA